MGRRTGVPLGVSQEVFHVFRRPCTHRFVSADYDRPLNKVRVLNHEPDYVICACDIIARSRINSSRLLAQHG